MIKFIVVEKEFIQISRDIFNKTFKSWKKIICMFFTVIYSCRFQYKISILLKEKYKIVFVQSFKVFTKNAIEI